MLQGLLPEALQVQVQVQVPELAQERMQGLAARAMRLKPQPAAQRSRWAGAARRSLQAAVVARACSTRYQRRLRGVPDR